ncbi:MAG: rsgA [Bacillales bacterium]|jgi:ribosome biogenesis GTPase|nr:rsgA [Bacillales bacterium]
MFTGIIIKSLAGFYYVLNESKIYQCRGRGLFRKQKITPLVGDYVKFQAENDTDGYIMEISDRKNELVRPPVANVDLALLVFSAKEPDFNFFLLNRFLVLVEYNNICPIIIVSKIDLLNENELVQLKQKLSYYENIGYKVFYTSMNDNCLNEEILEVLKDEVTVVAGQTGVGKSSLLNTLLPALELKTSEISKHLGRGKHTTRHVELHDIEGSLIADTPGFSSLELGEITIEELSSTFVEFHENSSLCKFRACTHISEPGCNIKKMLESGQINSERYDYYLSFIQEIKDRKPRY